MTLMHNPDYWVHAPLEDTLDHIIGGDWGKTSDHQDPEYQSVACIRGSEFKNWIKENGRTAVARKVKGSSLEKRSLSPGDILLEISGGGPDQPVGRTVLITQSVLDQFVTPVVGTNFLRLLRPSVLVNQDYINRYLEFFYKTGEVVRYQGGSNNLRNLKFKEYSQISVPIPAAAEQKVIADKLDALLAQVESTKARLDRIPQILKRFRQSVLAAAVSGRLTKEWRECNPHICKTKLSAIQEYWSENNRTEGKKYSAPKPIATNSQGNTPKNWLETNMGHVFQVFVGSTPRRSQEEYWGGLIPWVSSSEVAFCRISSTKETITETGLANASTTVHPAGTVMLAMIGQGRTRGQVAILDTPACHNQNTAALRVPEDFVIPEYLYYYLVQQYEETRRIGGGNNQKALNKRVVESMGFPMPPLEEQAEIVRRVDQLFAYADRIEQQVNNALERVNNLTQSILAKAFRGELTEQWRKDNPALISGDNSAKALLERIKAERAALKPAKRSRKKAGV